MAPKKMRARDTIIRLLVLRNKDKSRIDKRERRKGKGYKKNVDSLNTVNLVCFFFFFRKMVMWPEKSCSEHSVTEHPRGIRENNFSCLWVLQHPSRA